MEDGYKNIKKYYLRFTYVVRTVTNCLLDQTCVDTFDQSNKEKYLPITKDFMQFFQYFYDWDTNKNLLSQEEGTPGS